MPMGSGSWGRGGCGGCGSAAHTGPAHVCTGCFRPCLHPGTQCCNPVTHSPVRWTWLAPRSRCLMLILLLCLLWAGLSPSHSPSLSPRCSSPPCSWPCWPAMLPGEPGLPQELHCHLVSSEPGQGALAAFVPCSQQALAAAAGGGDCAWLGCEASQPPPTPWEIQPTCELGSSMGQRLQHELDCLQHKELHCSPQLGSRLRHPWEARLGGATAAPDALACPLRGTQRRWKCQGVLHGAVSKAGVEKSQDFCQSLVQLKK